MERDKWRLVRSMVQEFYEHHLSQMRGSLEEAVGERVNIFVHASRGAWGNAEARIERSMVTLLGSYAPRIMRVWFEETRDLDKPWDFVAVRGGEEIAVKVVSGEDAFNSATRRQVEETAPLASRCLVLTLQGDKEYWKPKVFGRVTWLSPVHSWSFATGDRLSYASFKRIVYEVGREYRARYDELLQHYMGLLAKKLSRGR